MRWITPASMTAILRREDPGDEVHWQRTLALAQGEGDAIAIQVGIAQPRSIVQLIRR